MGAYLPQRVLGEDVVDQRLVPDVPPLNGIECRP